MFAGFELRRRGRAFFGLQEGNEQDQDHARDGGKKADAEKDPVPKPSCKKAAQNPREDAAQVHEPRADGKVGRLVLGKAGSHKEGNENCRSQTAGKLVKAVHGGHKDEIGVPDGGHGLRPGVEQNIGAEKKTQSHVDQVG